MNESKFTRKIDGRRITEPTANGRNYSRGRSGILVDKQGIVRMVVSVAPNREQALEARIEAALKQ
jgi:hypothetical protein